MVCSPASSTSATKLDVFQMMAMHVAAKAKPGWVSHGTLAKPSQTRALLTRPWLYSKNQRKIRPANTSGSAHGSSRPRRTGHFTVKGWLASSASPRPTITAPGTVTTM